LGQADHAVPEGPAASTAGQEENTVMK
jgi:hypothetical protein